MNDDQCKCECEWEWEKPKTWLLLLLCLNIHRTVDGALKSWNLEHICLSLLCHHIVNIRKQAQVRIAAKNVMIFAQLMNKMYAFHFFYFAVLRCFNEIRNSTIFQTAKPKQFCRNARSNIHLSNGINDGKLHLL